MTIALYGATSHLGRLVAQELLQQGLDVVLGGRDLQKLRILSQEHGVVPVKSASIDHPVSLHALLHDCDVVINCAAPSSMCGEPLVRAALCTGTHYADPTGDQAFIRLVFERYGSEAEQRRIALVPALGFDYALGDCIARLVARAHEPAEEVVVAYAIQGSGVSSNSMRFAAETPGGGEVVYRDGAWRPVALEIDHATLDFPPPFGRQQMARYGSGEILTVPRHTQTRAVKALITAKSLVPHPAFLPIFPFVRPAVAFARRTPLRRLLALLARMASPAEPRENERALHQFMILVTVRGRDGSLGRGIVQGKDPDGITVASLVHGARQLAASDFDRAGPLGPAAAFDPEAFLNHLAHRGITWAIDPPR